MAKKKTELKLCSVEDCKKFAKNKSKYCSMHSARLCRTGSLNLKTSLEKLNERVIIAKNECWDYARYKNEWGYGRLRYKGKKILAHVLSWVLHFGEVPQGLLVLHKCDNPACVNPKHLFIGTHLDNCRDAIKKGRIDPHKRAKERWVKCPTLKK